MSPTVLRRVLSPAALVRLLPPWVAVAIAPALMPWLGHAPIPVVIVALVVLVAVILVAAFGVVEQAEQLAHRLGDPYGTLILTLSVVIIEVVLIAAVMLGPGEHTTIARDSVAAVMMIILNLVVGACLLIAGLRHRTVAAHNRTGTSVYLAMIGALVVVAFVLPAALGSGGGYSPAQAIIFAVLTVLTYGVFLWLQMGRQAADYRDPDRPDAPTRTADRGPRSELWWRAGVLVGTLVPIVLLSHDMAGLLDRVLDAAGAPVALSGLLIAIIVFTPETLTSVRAALRNETQRVINLNLGAFVSTVGLTIPSVLVIGLLTGQQVILAPDPAMLAVIIATVGVSAVTFLVPRASASQGVIHLAMFGVSLVVLLGL